MKTLNFDEWEKQYKPIRTLDTYGEDWEIIKTLDPKNVWTVLDADGISVELANGIHYINRLEYWECAEKWHEDITVSQKAAN